FVTWGVSATAAQTNFIRVLSGCFSAARAVSFSGFPPSMIKPSLRGLASEAVSFFKMCLAVNSYIVAVILFSVLPKNSESSRNPASGLAGQTIFIFSFTALSGGLDGTYGIRGAPPAVTAANEPEAVTIPASFGAD